MEELGVNASSFVVKMIQSRYSWKLLSTKRKDIFFNSFFHARKEKKKKPLDGDLRFIVKLHVLLSVYGSQWVAFRDVGVEDKGTQQSGLISVWWVRRAHYES